MRQDFSPRATTGWRARLTAAAAAALASTAAFAGTAGLSVDGFYVSTDNTDSTVFLYAPPEGQYQTYQTKSLNAGGLGGASPSNYLEVYDWGSYVRSSTTTNAYARADTNTFTDPLTQFTSVGFNLTATTTASSGVAPQQPNKAEADVTQSGYIGLLDSTGSFIAGNVSFDIYYSYSLSSPGGNALNDYTQVLLSLFASDATQTFDPYSFSALSSTLAGGVSGPQEGHIHLDFALTDGDLAFYSLTGTALAYSPAAAVPEPSGAAMAFAGMGVLGWCFKRRRKTAAKDEAVA